MTKTFQSIFNFVASVSALRLLNLAAGDAIGPMDKYSHYPQMQETCLQLTTKVTGLKPYLDTSIIGTIEACKLFWYCRVYSDVDHLSPNRHHKVEESSPVVALQFSCADANPRTPFFDAKACHCVDTSDHCSSDYNWRNQYKCTRPYTSTEKIESCRGFGDQGNYYLNAFPDFDSPSNYWTCDLTSNVTTSAISRNCSFLTKWNSKTCSCETFSNDEEAYHVRQANIHPMNRYACAVREKSLVISNLTFG